MISYNYGVIIYSVLLKENNMANKNISLIGVFEVINFKNQKVLLINCNLFVDIKVYYLFIQV